MSGFIIDADIAKAKTIHKRFYTNPVYFEASKEKIFARSWQFLSVAAGLKAGSCMPFQLLPGYLDEPLLLTKDQHNELRCMSNVCTHRGNLLVDEACSAVHLRCRYHGRIFGLDGKIISMPEF